MFMYEIDLMLYKGNIFISISRYHRQIIFGLIYTVDEYHGDVQHLS